MTGAISLTPAKTQLQQEIFYQSKGGFYGQMGDGY